MKALVVYDSYFGNTKLVANKIVEVISAKAIHVNDVVLEKQYDLLVLGCPTRAFHATQPMMTFLKGLDKTLVQKVAVFDTRIAEADVKQKFVSFMMRRFGYASSKMVKAIRKMKGIECVSEEHFYVKDTEGPLGESELSRATEWAKSFIK